MLAQSRKAAIRACGSIATVKPATKLGRIGSSILPTGDSHMKRNWTKTVSNILPPIFKDGKLYEFAYMFSHEKRYVEIPGAWTQQKFTVDEVPVEVVFGTAKEKP